MDCGPASTHVAQHRSLGIREVRLPLRTGLNPGSRRLPDPEQKDDSLPLGGKYGKLGGKPLMAGQSCRGIAFPDPPETGYGPRSG